MIYLAGVFDAEGYVTLTLSGNCIIGISMCNKEIPDIFQQTFGGSISDTKRENRRKVFHWKSKVDIIPKFIKKIHPFSIIKKSQLLLLDEYLNQRREDRRITRKEFVSKISACKRPQFADVNSLKIPTVIQPTDDFFQWLAGFFDGDGNFCCFEYKDPRSNTRRPMFASTLSCFNVIPDVIKFIKERLDGSISVLKQNKNPVWKWSCARNNLTYVLKSIFPHLKVKKECCRLMIEFTEIFNSRKRRAIGRNTGLCIKGGWHHPLFEYTQEEIVRLREIIELIKHHNSL